MRERDCVFYSLSADIYLSLFSPSHLSLSFSLSHLTRSLCIPLVICAVGAGAEDRGAAGAGVAGLSRLGSYPPYGCHVLAGALVISGDWVLTPV